MFSGALAAKESETIAQLKAEIEELKSRSKRTFDLPVAKIIPLKLQGEMKQPRLYFDAKKMEHLKASIEKHGVLEPILVRPNSYQIRFIYPT